MERPSEPVNLAKAPGRIRVLLAATRADVKAELRQLLVLIDENLAIGETTCGGTAVRQAAADRPDVILLDLETGGVEPDCNLTAIRGLRAVCPAAAILALTMRDDPDLRNTVLKEGADALFVKGPDNAALLTRIQFHLNRNTI